MNDLPPTSPFLAATQSLSLQLRSIRKSLLSIKSGLRTERRSDEPGKHVTSAVRIKNHCSSHVAFKDGGVQVQIMWMCSCFCISFLAVAKVTYPSNKTYTTDTTLAAFKRNH
ncbi:hypothetical protein L1987_00315 [Smallanthus sonchifolius]|uniref:Uncharacterized protein n=1 Tax=Smallanthus sonchifolius TaxID=185202 RepID=A0ACB9K241_9ASTR|nr:hypothetical protein L1987_00315 [Smallanthus sonchifolius]